MLQGGRAEGWKGGTAGPDPAPIRNGRYGGRGFAGGDAREPKGLSKTLVLKLRKTPSVMTTIVVIFQGRLCVC